MLGDPGGGWENLAALQGPCALGFTERQRWVRAQFPWSQVTGILEEQTPASASMGLLHFCSLAALPMSL